jgi:hypothetical protein
MSKVTLTTELPVSAEAACDLARKPELFKFIVWPILRVPTALFPEPVEVGTHGSARLWWFGTIPTWTHHLTANLEPPPDVHAHRRTPLPLHR